MFRPFHWLLASLCAAPLVAQERAIDLRVGHWVEVKGQVVERGRFQAEEIELVQPGSSEVLIGTVESLLSGNRFLLLGQVVEVDSDTEWTQIAPEQVLGQRLKVEGLYQGPVEFEADDIAVRGAGRDRIDGRIESVRERDGVVTWQVLGFEVSAPQALAVSHEGDWASFALAPARRAPGATLLSQSRAGSAFLSDEDRLPGSIRLGQHLTLGGQVEYEGAHESDFDLNDARRADQEDHQASLKLELQWSPRADFSALTNARISYEHELDQNDPDTQETRVVLSEAWGEWRDVLGSGLDLRFGRARTQDDREWLYDSNLDLVALTRARLGFKAELVVSTHLDQASPEDEHSLNLFGYVSNNDDQRHLGAYLIDRRDRRAGGDRTLHLGARALGEWLPASEVWLELSAVDGEVGGESTRGFAFDVGGVLEPDWLGPVSLIGGYAFGTGDATPGDGDSDTFRQTGLQDNNGKLASATSFRYYGEVLDPELANLGILTLGASIELARATTLSVLAHGYQLDQAEQGLFYKQGPNIKGALDGLGSDVGHEIDLVLGCRWFDGLQIEAVLGRFEPGAAFVNEDPAYLAAIQLRAKF